MSQKKAIVRPPGLSFCNCISTHPDRYRVSLRKALQQHEKYCTTLSDLGLEVIQLPPRDDLPDACFIEDTAVILNQKAVIARPKFESRRQEIESVSEVLKDNFDVVCIKPPGYLEGGDVIVTDREIICGITQRTNGNGKEQLSAHLDQQVIPIVDPTIMHLKSYITHINASKLIANAKYSRHPSLSNFEIIELPDDEDYGANSITIDGVTILPKNASKSEGILNNLGIETMTLNMSEFNKCDGALSCLSLIF